MMTRLRDPFEMPHAFEPDERFKRAVAKLLPAGMDPNTAIVLVGSPTDLEPWVIGSDVGPACLRCGRRIWLAPSSRAISPKRLAPICFPCAVAL